MSHHVRAAGLAILAMTIVASCVGMLPASAAEDPQTPTSGSIDIHVVDADGKPVPSARIHLSVWTDDKQFKKNRDYTCNDQGTAALPLPKTLRIIRVWATAKGYAGMFAQLWPQTPAEIPLPTEFTFKLVQGTSMSGVVKNDDGQPIKGARVEVQYDSGGVGDNTCPPARFDDSIAYGILGCLTDAEGHWKAHNVPPGDEVEVRLKVTHREYLNDEDYGSLQKAQHVTHEQLRDGSATIVMHRGLPVSGHITDAEGKPVSDAVVIWGDRPYWQEGSQEVRTDKDGVYRTPPLASGLTRFTIVAPHWMPQTRKIDVTPGMQPVDFQLARGKKLRLKFVDDQGTPVPDVYVAVDKWRGVESLYNHKHPNVVDVQIPRTADKDGIYEWTWAPDDAVDYRFGAKGFASNEASIAADDQEHVVTIHGEFEIAGTVTDAATGKPIDDFRVVPIIHFRPEFPFLPRNDSQAFTGSKFRMAFDRADIEHGVQIEALGYRPFRTERRYKLGDPNVNLDVKLQPTEHQLGSVVDGNGQPVADAKVYVASYYQHLDLNSLDGREQSFGSNYLVSTDAEGHFEIVPQFERYKLIVVAPGGYAEAEHSAEDKPGELHLLPWAKLSGRVLQDGRPVPDTQVYWSPIQLRGGEEPRADVRLAATTAADGSFAFDRLPPVKCVVEPFLHFSRESPLKSSRSMPLDLCPGDDRNVELGGGGAEITGRLVLDKPRDPFDFHFSLTWLVAKRPGVDVPATLAAKGFDWSKGWSDAWRNSQEGGASQLLASLVRQTGSRWPHSYFRRRARRLRAGGQPVRHDRGLPGASPGHARRADHGSCGRKVARPGRRRDSDQCRACRWRCGCQFRSSNARRQAGRPGQPARALRADRLLGHLVPPLRDTPAGSRRAGQAVRRQAGRDRRESRLGQGQGAGVSQAAPAGLAPRAVGRMVQHRRAQTVRRLQRTGLRAGRPPGPDRGDRIFAGEDGRHARTVHKVIGGPPKGPC